MQDLGLRRGIVRKNDDPEQMGRLVIEVPGIIDESAWALPAGLPGAGNQRQGLWDIPKVGAQVWVLFEAGDVDSPVWLAGPFTRTDEPNVPTDARAAVLADPKDAHRLRCLETDYFTLTWDERTDPEAPYDPVRSKQFMQLRHKESGDTIEIDGIRRGILMKATSAVVIECAGIIRLDGLQVQINDRIVQPGTHLI